MAILILVPNCHTYFDIMSNTEGVVFDRELRRKFHAKDLNNRLLNCIQHEHTGMSTVPYLIVKRGELDSFYMHVGPVLTLIS